MSRLITRVPARPISRRSFMATTAGAAVAGSLLLPRGAKAQPKRGGTIRVAKGHGQTTDTLNPATYENGFMTATTYAINGYLVGIGTDGNLEPELAESWEATPDAKTWRFKLRSGVTFHDGRPLTINDVLASIEFHKGESSTSVIKPLLESIESFSADGDDTLVCVLKGGDADFPFAFTDYHMAINPANDSGSVDWQSGNGCGPYKLVSFEPGVQATFERNENDWNSERGWFERIEILAVVDINARTTALISGDVHAIDKPDLKTIGLLERNPNVTIHSVAGNLHYEFAMSTNKDPFTDRNVRLALKHAINRQELVDKILFGYGSVGNDHPIGRGQRFFNDELPQRTYDPDKAKFYLKEAGLDRLQVELAAADAAFAGAVDAAVLFQASAAACNIDLKVNRVPNDGYWSDVWMTHPFSAVYWSGRVVEDAMLTTTYSSGASWNDTFWSNARFDELLVAARSELDEAKRREMYFEMQTLINEDGGALIPMFANWTFVVSKDLVTGDQFASNWDMDGERWMERWSFA